MCTLICLYLIWKISCKNNINEETHDEIDEMHEQTNQEPDCPEPENTQLEDEVETNTQS